MKKKHSWRRTAPITLGILATLISQAHAEAFKELPLAPGYEMERFKVERIYLGPSGSPLAVRWLHQGTCTPVTILQKDLIPQFLISIQTPVDSDEGLPHALEHLLVGKGLKGRYWNLLSKMRLARSSAATDHDDTYYGFDAPIGSDAFFEELEALFEALFRPDFTDEEARQEFYHFDVEKDSDQMTYRLTEAGTVYSEIQGNYGHFDYWRLMKSLTLGKSHPWAFNSGGNPEPMRHVIPEMIRQYHRKHYHLGLSTPLYIGLAPDVPLWLFFKRLDHELTSFSDRLRQGECPSSLRKAALDRYPIVSEATPQLNFVPFPSKNASDPASLDLAWNPIKTESSKKIRLLQLFLSILVKDNESPLYLDLVSSRSKRLESGATAVSASVDTDHSAIWPAPVLTVSGIPANSMTESAARKIRKIILETISRIADEKQNSPLLEQLKNKALATIEATRKDADLWLKEPPKLGVYEGFSSWRRHLEFLEIESGSQIPLMDDAPNQLKTLIKEQVNPWKEVIEEFGLKRAPHLIVSLPSPALLKKDEQDRNERFATESARLMGLYHTADPQKALVSFALDQEAIQHRIHQLGQNVPRPPFVMNPPLSPDPLAKYKRGKLRNGIPFHATFFDDVPEHEVTLRFNLKKAPRALYPYFSVLSLLSLKAGLNEGDRITSPAQFTSLLEKDGSSIGNFIDADPDRHQYVWGVWASGRSDLELKRSLNYLRRALFFPNLSYENLPWIREVLKKVITENASLTQGGSAPWGFNAAEVYRHQNDPIYLATSSTFALAHWVERILWRLHDPISNSDLSALNRNMTALLDRTPNRSVGDWEKAIQALPSEGVTGEFKEYALRNLHLFPPHRLREGLSLITEETLADLRVGPERVLSELRELQKTLLDRETVSVELTTTPEGWQSLRSHLVAYTSGFPKVSRNSNSSNQARPLQDELPILENIRAHAPGLKPQYPVYLGFVNDDWTSGQLIIDANGPNLSALGSLDKVLSFTAMAGAGPHTFFMKTWEAGLAYSNGVNANLVDGRISYFAERAINLGALLRFVRTQAQQPPSLAGDALKDYALATLFDTSRMIEGPIERSRALAADFRNGATPAKYRRFFSALLKRSSRSGYSAKMIRGIPNAVAPLILGGDNVAAKREAQSLFLLIGPESQLKTVDADIPLGSELYRVWQSDFWLSWP